jgi:hypothetical protein
MTTARQLAMLIIKAKSCLYSQWFLGGDNVVSDALSRDFHLSSNDLSKLISSSVPDQVPFGLTIQDLPNEISSWLTCLLLNQPSNKQWLKEPTQSKLAHGLDRRPISTLLDVNMISSSNHSQGLNDIAYLQPSLMQSEKVNLVLKTIHASSPNQSVPPWIAWHRPLSWLTNPTQDWTEKKNLPLFYNASSEVIQTQTNQQSHRLL